MSMKMRSVLFSYLDLMKTEPPLALYGMIRDEARERDESHRERE